MLAGIITLTLYIMPSVIVLAKDAMNQIQKSILWHRLFKDEQYLFLVGG